MFRDLSKAFDCLPTPHFAYNLQDCETPTHWFGGNGVKVNIKKVQFMPLPSNQNEVTHLRLCGDILINSENGVKVLGIVIDS